jgi:hypothetical protein
MSITAVVVWELTPCAKRRMHGWFTVPYFPSQTNWNSTTSLYSSEVYFVLGQWHKRPFMLCKPIQTKEQRHKGFIYSSFPSLSASTLFNARFNEHPKFVSCRRKLKFNCCSTSIRILKFERNKALCWLWTNVACCLNELWIINCGGKRPMQYMCLKTHCHFYLKHGVLCWMWTKWCAEDCNYELKQWTLKLSFWCQGAIALVQPRGLVLIVNQWCVV